MQRKTMLTVTGLVLGLTVGCAPTPRESCTELVEARRACGPGESLVCANESDSLETDEDLCAADYWMCLREGDVCQPSAECGEQYFACLGRDDAPMFTPPAVRPEPEPPPTSGAGRDGYRRGAALLLLLLLFG